MDNKNTLLSHLKIAGIVTPKSKVLDLGCGNGDLMYLLEQNKKVNAQGVEISEDAIYKCVEKGLCVMHSDIDGALDFYKEDTFDFVGSNNSNNNNKQISSNNNNSINQYDFDFMNNTFIIAEIGINHNGSLDIAKLLIDWAVKCGCDAVKFQKRTVKTRRHQI